MKKTASRTNSTRRSTRNAAPAPKQRRWLIGGVLLFIGAGLSYAFTQYLSVRPVAARSDILDLGAFAAPRTVSEPRAEPSNVAPRSLYGLLGAPTGHAWSDIVLLS